MQAVNKRTQHWGPQMTEVSRPAKLDINFEAAKQFLKCLDDTTDVFCFRTYPDNGDDKKLNKNWTTTFEEAKYDLAAFNERGASVCVVINEGGHTDSDIHRVRYIFVDTDGASPKPLIDALKPHIMIESSPRRYHIYWKVSDCEVAKFNAVQHALAKKYGTDPVIKNPSRIMRIPGFFHQKSAPTEVTILYQNLARPTYSIDEICSSLGLKSNEPAFERSAPSTVAPAYKTHFSLTEIEQMLTHLEPFDDYNQWIKVGFMLAEYYGEEARELFLKWSRGDLWCGGNYAS